MELEEQLGAESDKQITFLARQEEIEKRIEHYKFSAKYGAAFGYIILAAGLISPETRGSLSEDPDSIFILTVWAPYGMAASQYVIDKTIDFKNLVQERVLPNLTNWYKKHNFSSI